MPLGLFGNELIDEIAAQGIILGAKTLAKSLFSSVGKKVADKGPKSVEDLMSAILDPSSVDEQIYNRAKRKMLPEDRIRLSKKTAEFDVPGRPALSQLRHNWFRSTLPLNDVDETAAVLTGYARLSKEAWDRECLEMDYKHEREGLTFQSIIDAVAAKQQTVSNQFSAHPVRNAVKGWRDRAVDRARNQPW